MLSYMVAKSEEQDDEEISIRAIARIASVFVAAGSTSISYQVPLILFYLLQEENKDKLVELKANLHDDKFMEQAINEMMRISTSFQLLYRIAKQDMEVSEQQIKEDEIIAVSLASSNLDPEIFPNPENIDFQRPNAHKHQGFGNGVHYCIGKHLAIKEMTIALRELLTRFPNLRLDSNNPPVFDTEVVAVRGFKSFPVLV